MADTVPNKPQPVLQDQLQRYVDESEKIRRHNAYLCGMVNGMSNREVVDAVRVRMQPSWSLPPVLVVEWHPADGVPPQATGFYEDSAPAPQAQEAGK